MMILSDGPIPVRKLAISVLEDAVVLIGESRDPIKALESAARPWESSRSELWPILTEAFSVVVPGFTTLAALDYGTESDVYVAAAKWLRS